MATSSQTSRLETHLRFWRYLLSTYSLLLQRSNYEKKINSLRTVFEIAEPHNNKPREIPDHLVDMITFEPMHDPVMTKNGHSYERATIYEHLKRTATDPLTRQVLPTERAQPCRRSMRFNVQQGLMRNRDVLKKEDLRSNFGLKAACDEFWDSGAREWIIDW